RMRKFVGRHRAAVWAGGAVVVALVGGVIGTTIEMVRALRAEQAEVRLRQTALAARDAERVQRERADHQAEEALKQARSANDRRAEMQRVADFQASQLSGIDVQAMGARLRRQVLAEVHAAKSEANRNDTQARAAAQLEEVLASVNWTNVAREQ